MQDREPRPPAARRPGSADADDRTSGAAIFLDRDGTLIPDRGPLLDPAAVELLPGVPEALRRLTGAGYRLIVVTNQSAVGRGLLAVERLDQIHAALRAALAAEGAGIDALYFCPDAPDARTGPESPVARRKPGAGMLLEAAREHGLELARCFMVGDQARDTLAGKRAGCRASILVRTGQGEAFTGHASDYDVLCDDLPAAADWILAVDRREPRRGRPGALRAGRR